MDIKKIMTILNALLADYDEFVDNDQMDDADSTWKYAMEQLTDFIEEEKKKSEFKGAKKLAGMLKGTIDSYADSKIEEKLKTLIK